MQVAAASMLLVGCGGAPDGGRARPLEADYAGWTRYSAPDGSFELLVPPRWERVESGAQIGWRSDTTHTFFSVYRRPAREDEADTWIESSRNIDNIEVEVLANDDVDVDGVAVPRVRVREVGTGFDRAGRAEIVEMRFFPQGTDTVCVAYRLRDAPHGASDEERRTAAAMLEGFSLIDGRRRPRPRPRPRR